MNHDEQCELPNTRGMSCRCGSRAYQLCPGCRDGLHLKHTEPCECPLEESA